MSTVEIKLGSVDGLFSRMMYFKTAGDIENTHTHQFHHLTLLAAGALRITVDGTSTEFKAPHMIYIHKDKEHELVALEDKTVAYCIHAMPMDWVDRNAPSIVDSSMVPNGVAVG